MRKQLTVILILLLSLWGCGDDSESKSKCDPACAAPYECIYGFCGLKPGVCTEDWDCEDNTDGTTACNLETNRCVKPTTLKCTPAERRCKPDKTAIEQCNIDGEWTIETTCKTSEICGDDLTCQIDNTICTAGAQRCNAEKNSIETCNTTGEWIEGVQCSGLDVCTRENNTAICSEQKPDLEEIEELIFMNARCKISEFSFSMASTIQNIHERFNSDQSDEHNIFFQYMLDRDTRQIGCLRSTTDCEAFTRCLDIEVTDQRCEMSTASCFSINGGEEECTYSGFMATCEGNRTVQCGLEEIVIKTTCPEHTVCTVDQKWNNVTCKPVTPAHCNTDGTITDYTTGEPRIYHCQDNYTCGKDEEDNTACIIDPALPSCDPFEYAASCNGSILTECVDGKIIQKDCKTSSPDHICSLDPDSDRYTCNSTKPDPCPESPGCNGDVLTYCIDGVTKTYNCKENGFLTCSDKGFGFFSIPTCVHKDFYCSSCGWEEKCNETGTACIFDCSSCRNGEVCNETQTACIDEIFTSCDQCRAGTVCNIAETECVTVSGNPISISEAKQLSDNLYVTLEGLTITGYMPGAGIKIKGFFAEKDGEGIYIYFPDRAYPDHIPDPGSIVTVGGTLKDYYGLTEIEITDNSGFVQQTGTDSIPEAITGTLPLKESYESILVKIEGSFELIEMGTSENYWETRLRYNSDQILIMKSSIYPFQDNTQILVGTTFSSITGFIREYNNTYSIMPRSADDLVIIE